MKNGYGSPYVKVFSSQGEITSKITDFVYKYSQEEDDTCQLRVEEKDVNLPDRPEFQEGAILRVMWGYLNEQSKMVREVVIRNIKPSYTETTISLDLLCTDKASRIKGTSSKKIHKGTITDIAKDIAKKNGLTYNGISETKDGLAIDVTDIQGIAKPGYYDNNGNYTIAVDNTAVPRRIDFRIYDQLPQANKSDFHVLKDAADGDPNGPLEVYGRDGELVVAKKNTNQKPIKTYTYAGGDGLLLNFHPETKNLSRHQGSSNINIDAFNPENKTSYNIDANDFTNNLPKLGDMVDVPPRFYNNLGNASESDVENKTIITSGNQKDQVTNYKNQGKGKTKAINADKPQAKITWEEFRKESAAGKLKNAEAGFDTKLEKNPADVYDGNYALKTTYGVVNFVTYNTAAPGFYDKDGYYTVAIDKTAVVVPHGQAFDEALKPIDYNKSQPSSEHGLQDAYAKGANRQADNSLKKNPAECEVVGDPILQSGKVLSILNVSKKYSGNYYIDTCEHRMQSGQAYKCIMTMSKNALGSTRTDTPTKAKANSFDGIPKISKSTVINKDVKPLNLEGKSLREQLAILGPEKPITKNWKGSGQ